MHLKIHRTPMGEVVAICDSELIGTILAEGAFRLDLAAHAAFYSGKKVGEDEAVAALKEAENVNIVGRRSLAAAKKAGIDISGAITVQKVPHLQIYRI